MQVEYTNYSYSKERLVESIGAFLYDQLLHEYSYSGDRDKVRLENQPELVCMALGRLVSILLDKNILNLEDLHSIADTGSMKDLKLKIENET